MNSIKLLDVRIDNASYRTTLKTIQKYIHSKQPHQICTVNPEYIMSAQKDDELKHIINSSSLNVADGGGLIFAAKHTRQKLDHKVTGVDLTYKLAKLSKKNKYKIFLLGGFNNTAIKTKKILEKKYPGCKIVGTYEGSPNLKTISKKIYLNDYKAIRSFDVQRNTLLTKNNLNIIKQVASKKPDILLVAYGCPKQDKFIARYAKLLHVPVMIGVGGTFDYISGAVSRAPAWMRSIHLEWLYRLFTQPKRFDRIITATFRFPWKIITDN